MTDQYQYSLEFAPMDSCTEPHELVSPTLVGNHVRLRPTAQADMEFIYLTSIDEHNGFRWRYRGTIPDRAEFAKAFHNGVLVQFIVERRATTEPIGIVSAYGANQRDGWTYVAGLSAAEFQQTGAIMDGMATLIDYVLIQWPFRKIYFETIEFNYEQFRLGIGEFAEEEGRLRRHFFYNGRWWDLITGAIYREDWFQYRTKPKEWLNAKRSEVLTVCELCELVVKEFRLDPALVSPDSMLIQDLDFDSLRMMELDAIIRDLVGDVGFEMIGEVGTLRDVWTWYSTALSMPILSST